MAFATAREIFETYLPSRFASKADLVAKVNAAYKFVLEGPGGGTWVVDLTKPGGKVTAGDAPAGCTITMATVDFLEMMNGKLNAQMAFLAGKLRVAGDMGLALKLSGILT